MLHNSFFLLDFSKDEMNSAEIFSEVEHIHAMPPEEIELAIQKGADEIMPSACDDIRLATQFLKLVNEDVRDYSGLPNSSDG